MVCTYSLSLSPYSKVVGGLLVGIHTERLIKDLKRYALKRYAHFAVAWDRHGSSPLPAPAAPSAPNSDKQYVCADTGTQQSKIA